MLKNQISIPYEVLKAEKEPVVTTNQKHEYDDYEPESFDFVSEYLYHGIRFQTYLEKLENIFKEGKILSGKYLKNYHYYDDNCNKGKYVSLLKLAGNNKLEYKTFIEENISLLITPYCDAIETKYVDFYTWDKIKNLDLKQIYSYMPGECLVKDYIPIEYVKAIGVPYVKIIREKGKEYANNLLNDIKLLMEQYDLSFPIIDTSRFNQILIPSKKDIKTKSLKK